LFDWGSHFVDQIWRLMWPARPVRLFAQLRANLWSADCDDFARICLDFDSGAVALVEINTTTTRPLARWHIDGTHGSADSPPSATFDVATWAKLQFTKANPATCSDIGAADQGRIDELRVHAIGTVKDVDRQDDANSEALSESAIWERFARAVRLGEPPAVPAASVLPTMSLLDAARQSSQRGIAVEISCDGWEY
jgi:predicted dehydrogenase